MSATEFARNLRERVNTGNVESVKVTFSLDGGPPTKRVTKQIDFLGNTDVHLRRRDERLDDRVLTRQSKINNTELKDLFLKVAASVEALGAESKPRFVQDSEIGAIGIEIGGKKISKYFLVNEIDRRIQKKPIPNELQVVIDDVMRISKKMEGR